MNRYKRKRAKNCTFSIETHSIIVVEGINTRNRERAVVREKTGIGNKKERGKRCRLSSRSFLYPLPPTYFRLLLIIILSVSKMLLRYTCKTEDINIVITEFAIDSSMARISCLG